MKKYAVDVKELEKVVEDTCGVLFTNEKVADEVFKTICYAIEEYLEDCERITPLFAEAHIGNEIFHRMAEDDIERITKKEIVHILAESIIPFVEYKARENPRFNVHVVTGKVNISSHRTEDGDVEEMEE